MNGAERILAHVEQQARHPPGRDHAGRPLHAVGRRVPRLLRHRADDDGERRLPREPDPREGRRAAGGAEIAMPGRQLIMSFPVTATSHSLRGVPRARRLRARSTKALRTMKPPDVIKEVTASGLQGRGGAAFAVGRKWQVVVVRRRPAALPDRQRRRGRARHVQGPLDPREQPARAARVDADLELRAQRAQLLRLHPRRVRPALPPPRRRGRGSLRRRLLRRATSSAPTSPATSSSTAAPARTSPARHRA